MKLLDDLKLKCKTVSVRRIGFINRGLLIAMLAAIIFPGAAFADTMQVPSGQLEIPQYAATASPVISSDPFQAEPISVGSVASGGSQINIAAQLEAFSGPVDIYFGLYAPALDANNVYILKDDGSYQTLAQGLVPWKSAQTGPLSEDLLTNISVTDLPAGTYTFYLLVSPAGTTDDFYFWNTSITIGEGITQASLAGSWYGNAGASNTPFWSRGPLSIDANGNVSGTITDWQGNSHSANETMTMNSGIITNSGSSTFQGAMDSGGTVIAGTETDDNQAKLFLVTKNQGASYSTADMNGIWEIYTFESLEDSSGQSEGPWWSRGPMTISNGLWSANLSDWDGTTEIDNGTITINPDNGIMSITIAGLSNNQFQCSMDSGKTVAACTWNSGANGGNGTGIGLLVKAPSTKISLSDLAGTWQMQEIEYEGPSWGRGSMTYDSSGNMTAGSWTTMHGTHNGTCSGATCPSTSFTINGDVIMPTLSSGGLNNQQCSMDADKTIMVCTGSGEGDDPIYAELIIMLKQ
jgi:hypothetical protein